MDKTLRYENCFKYVNKFLLYIVTICLVIECRSLWMHMPKVINRYLLLDSLNNILLICGIILLCKNGMHFKNIFMGAVVTLGVFLYGKVFLMHNSVNSENFTRLFIPVIVLYIICRLNFLDEIIECYTNVVCLIAFISLFFFVFASLLKVLPYREELLVWGGRENVKFYFNIYAEPQTVSFLGIYRGIRNTAMFVEAPMASLHFSLALLVENFLAKKKRNFKSVVLIIAIITTFSTTGYLVIIAIYGWWLLKMLWKDAFARKIIPIFGVVIGFMGLFILIKRLNTPGTGDLRIDDFKACYKAWKQSPIWGTGYENVDVIKSYMSDFRSNNMGLSNTIGPILAQGGLFLFLPYFCCGLKGILSTISNKDWDLLVCIVLFLVVTTITIVPYQWLYILALIIMGNMKIKWFELKYKECVLYSEK